MQNKVLLVGRLGADPEERTTQSGIKVTNLSVATWKNRKDQNGDWHVDTEWHKVTVWGDYPPRAGKGDLVVVEGELRTRKWDDKEGITRYSTEIHGTVRPVPKPKDDSKMEAAPRDLPADGRAKEGVRQEPVHDDPEDDLPF